MGKKLLKMKIGDEEFSSEVEAIRRRILLNKDIKRTGDINLVNRVLKRGNKFIVRASSKKIS